MANGAPTVSNGLVISGITTTSEILVGNTIKLDPVAGIVTAPAVDVDDFLDVGSNIKLGNAGVITATSFSGSGANLTSIPAAQLTGSLPAIDGSNLTGLASREVYGFTGIGKSLSLTTTNNGADNITNATYAAFEENFIGPSGITFSINTSGNLIMTV